LLACGISQPCLAKKKKPPKPPAITLTASATTVNEGQNVTFTIHASTTNSSQTITVNYSRSGTATTPADYSLSGTSGKFTLPPGASSATVTLSAIFDSTSPEPNETATLTLLSGTGYKIGTGNKTPKSTVTIVNVEPNEVTIDDFESSGAPAPWTFYNGAEFPGATGSLGSGTGFAGTGAHLNFDFSGGGAFVSADRELATFMTAEAVALRIKAHGDTSMALRVRDFTGQILQYAFWRPLEAQDGNAWYRQVVQLDAPTGHFAGADDGIVHQPIVAISIMASTLSAGPGLEQNLVGAIDFDNVSVIHTLRVDLDPFGAAMIPAPTGKENLMSGLGVAVHFPVSPSFNIDTQMLDAARDAGFTWVRTDFWWSDIEGVNGVYDFSRFDTFTAECEGRGLKPHFLMILANSVHSDCRCNPSDPQPIPWWQQCPGQPDNRCFVYAPQSTGTITAYGNYAQAAATHFVSKDIRFEIWNEPNWYPFWAPTPNSTQYAALATEAIARIHTGDAAAQVMAVSLAGFDLNFLITVLNLGGGTNANAISIHPYKTPPESASDELLRARSIVATMLSPETPVWDSESGYSSTWFGYGTTPDARKRQAVMTVRKMLSAQVLGIPMSIYYDLRDDGTDGANFESNFGLLARDYSDKPAMTGVRTLKSVATDRTFVGSYLVDPTSLHVVRLNGASDVVLVCWFDQPGGQIQLTVPAPATATDMFGVALSGVTTGDRVSFTATDNNGPIYITLPSP
jgi:hypothetical protein